MLKEIYDSDNLIYNRYDLIYSDRYKVYSYICDNKIYEIQAYCNNGIVEVNLWGKKLQNEVWSRLIADIFYAKEVYAIKIVRSGNQYASFLEETNDIRVPLPDSFEELMNRVERRDRSTIRRKLRWLNERVGSLKIEVYAREDISDPIVETYFRWKKETHGTEYGLSPQEYLDKYYVTNAMLMKAGETEVAVAFFCQVEDIVFFENFSYNGQLKEYSPGLLMYVEFMKELIRRKCSYVYLGGGSYVYKTRFGADSSVAYSGLIYRQDIVENINAFFVKNAINTTAFYGYGVCGHAFLQLSKNIEITVPYGIDRNSTEESDIAIYSPEEELPETDAVLITLNNKNKDVESLLCKRFKKVYYWNDILEKVIDDYRWRIDEIT